MRPATRKLAGAAALAVASPLLLPLAAIWLLDLSLALTQGAATLALARHGSGWAWAAVPGAAMALASVAMREVDVMRSNATYAVAILGMGSMAVPLTALRAVGHISPQAVVAVSLACAFAMSAAMLALALDGRRYKRQALPGIPGPSPGQMTVPPP